MSSFKNRDFFNIFAADIDEVMNWFGKYDIESIELVVSSIINTQDETKLIVGNKLEQTGVKISFIPFKNQRNSAFRKNDTDGDHTLSNGLKTNENE